MKLKSTLLNDERQDLLNNNALVIGLIFGIFLDLGMMVYGIVTRNIEVTYPYLLQLIVMSVGICLASFLKKDISLPKTMLGKTVDPGTERKAVLSRLAWCVRDAFGFAAVLTLLDAYVEKKVTGSLVGDGLLSFLVFTVLNVIWCEFRVRRYRRQEAKLDAEENDLGE